MRASNSKESVGSGVASNLASPTGQQLKAWNRGLLRSVASLLSDESVGPGENSDGEPGSARSSPKGQRPKLPKGSLSARGKVESKQEYDARRRKQEHIARHKNLLEQREKDRKQIQERCQRVQLEREQRFEAMMEELSAGDDLRVQAADRIRERDVADHEHREALYNEWDTQVFQRIEWKLQKYMTGHGAAHTNLGADARMDLHPQDDPLKRGTIEAHHEENFRRTADAIMQDGTMGRRSDQLQDVIKQRELDEAAVRNRLTCRPMFPVPLWEQRQHYATPYGYFAQGCEKGTGFHSARRMGEDVHRPDEKDGTEAAGKTRSRVETKSFGMLAGPTAKRGQSFLQKRLHGASCGAPCQDHYRYDRTNQSADLEFPLGKKCFPDLH